MSHTFYGSQAAVTSINPHYPDIRTPQDLFDRLLNLWDRETCTPRLRDEWTPDNPTLGQCSITAFLAQDIFGGQVYGLPLEGGGVHCFNLVGGCAFDLTSEQFEGKSLNYDDRVEQRREDHFARREKQLRYEVLRDKLEARGSGQ